MTPPLPCPLPSRDLTLLRVALRVVPDQDRSDWLRCWQAELWHRHHPRTGPAQPATDLYPGLLRDALWLRQECWRRAVAGTAVLCLIALAMLAVIVLLPLFAYFDDLYAMSSFLVRELPRFAGEAVLTSIVSFAFASRATVHVEPHTHSVRLRAYLFEAAKLILLQIVAYLLSLDSTQPFYLSHRFATEILQPQLFTLIALLALRWGLADQNNRCRHCLRSLREPLRVGRPSWNFLESNGTQLICPDGHGLLSVPEIETSWRNSSEWIAQ